MCSVDINCASRRLCSGSSAEGGARVTCQNFNDFLFSLTRYDTHLDLTMRTFIKIVHLTYGKLRHLVNRVARYSELEGLGVGDRIMLKAV